MVSSQTGFGIWWDLWIVRNLTKLPPIDITFSRLGGNAESQLPAQWILNMFLFRDCCLNLIFFFFFFGIEGWLVNRKRISGGLEEEGGSRSESKSRKSCHLCLKIWKVTFVWNLKCYSLFLKRPKIIYDLHLCERHVKAWVGVLTVSDADEWFYCVVFSSKWPFFYL